MKGKQQSIEVVKKPSNFQATKLDRQVPDTKSSIGARLRDYAYTTCISIKSNVLNASKYLILVQLGMLHKQWH